VVKVLTLDVPVTGDCTGTALGWLLSFRDVDELLLPGLAFVQDTIPTLGQATRELLDVLTNRRMVVGAEECALIKIDRKLDAQSLCRGRLKVLDCDKGKILALIAALVSIRSERATELLLALVSSLATGGIRIRTRIEEQSDGAAQVHVEILDQSLEIKLTRQS
jgi:hypothetical protein